MSLPKFPLLQTITSETLRADDVVWSPDGTSLALGDNGNIQIWRWNAGLQQYEQVKLLNQDVDRLHRILWQSSHLASITTALNGQQQHKIITWDTLLWEPTANITSHEAGLTHLSLALNPDGSRIVYTQPSGDLVIKSFPTANAGPDQTLSTASDTAPVSLDATASTDPDGSIVSYDWQLNGATIATGPSPQVELPVGEHRITLLVTDNDGLIDTDEVTITVREATPDMSWRG